MSRVSRISIIFIVIISAVFSCLQSLADTADFVPVSGTDATGDAPAALSSTASGDIFKLSASDDKRMASNAAWPGAGAYDESKYLEFVFAPAVPDDAVISTVTVTNEFRRNAVLSAAKLEIWDGSAWQDVPLTLPDASGADITETKDISSFIATPAALNGLKIRFLAYRDTVATSATTSHDYLDVSATYTQAAATDTPVPSDTPASTDTPSPTVTPISTPTPSASPSPTAAPTSSPLPTPSHTPTPTPTKTPTPTPAAAPVQTATPTPSISPTASPSPSVSATPTATPSPTLAPTPSPTAAPIETPAVLEVVPPAPKAVVYAGNFDSAPPQTLMRPYAARWLYMHRAQPTPTPTPSATPLPTPVPVHPGVFLRLGSSIGKLFGVIK